MGRPGGLRMVVGDLRVDQGGWVIADGYPDGHCSLQESTMQQVQTTVAANSQDSLKGFASPAENRPAADQKHDLKYSMSRS